MADQTSGKLVPEDEDDVFLRQFVLSEEDRRRRHPASKWIGGYRWFRTQNVICLDRYRSPAEMARIHNVLLTSRPPTHR
jgi:hypothetical protein